MALRKQFQAFVAAQTCLEAVISYCAARKSSALSRYQTHFAHGITQYVQRQSKSLTFTVDLAWLAHVFAVQTKLSSIDKALTRLKLVLPRVDKAFYFRTRPHWVLHEYSPQHETLQLTYEGDGVEDAPPKGDTNARWFTRTYGHKHQRTQRRRSITLRCLSGAPSSFAVMYIIE